MGGKKKYLGGGQHKFRRRGPNIYIFFFGWIRTIIFWKESTKLFFGSGKKKLSGEKK